MRRLLLLVGVLFVLGAGTASAAPRMYLGFLDDVSFRWAPDRTTSFDLARQSHASVVRTVVRWYDVAPVRPAVAADSGDPAYDFRDVDEFIRNAQQRGLEVLLTVWGTPPWANGGRAANVPPDDPRDLQAFATALADRYSGRHAGYPFARFFSIWNEPNSPRFLQAANPAAAYARLAEAGYAGVKAGSPQALVGIGETASRHAPASFMQAVARANPQLRFDAWSHHPYPALAGQSPDVPARWPNVGMPELARFGSALDSAFHRKGTRVWLTEYAESTTEVSAQKQAADISRAVTLAARLPQVDMFVWMMLRNHDGEPWQSGLVGTAGYDAFQAAAFAVDPRNAFVAIDARDTSHVFHVPALELKSHIAVADAVGVKLQLGSCKPVSMAAKMEPDGWVPVQLTLRAQPGVRYRVDVQIQDVHGFTVHRTLELAAAGPAGQRAVAATEAPC